MAGVLVELFVGGGDVFVLHDVGEPGVLLVADRRVERGGAIAGGDELRDPLARHAHLVGDLGIGRLASQLLMEAHPDPSDLGDAVHEMHRQADGLPLVGQGPLDGLLDPPGGIGGELGALGRVEAVDRAHQAHVALVDHVEERQPHAVVVLGDLHDQPQVGLDHLLPGGLVALVDALRQRGLLGKREQRGLADLAEIQPQVHVAVPGQALPSLPRHGDRRGRIGRHELQAGRCHRPGIGDGDHRCGCRPTGRDGEDGPATAVEDGGGLRPAERLHKCHHGVRC